MLITVILGDPGADSGAEDKNQNRWEKIQKTFLPNQERVFVQPFGTGV